MKRRLFNLLAVLSLLLAAAAAVVWVISYPQYRPEFADLSYSVGRAGWDNQSGRLVLWAGRIPDRPTPFVSEWHVPGLSYRRSAGPNALTLIMVPHGLLVAALLLPPAVVLRHALRARRGARRAAAGQCTACGYDLRATPGACTECGRARAAPPPTPLPPRRVFHRLPRRARKSCRAAVLASSAAALALLAPVAVCFALWRPVQWEHQSATTRSAWGCDGRNYYLTRISRAPGAGPLAGETAVVSAGKLLGTGRFVFGGWSASDRDLYYSRDPADAHVTEHDPQRLSTYRRVTDEVRRDFWLDAWYIAGVLLLPALLVLLNALRRYITHGYWFAGRGVPVPATRKGGDKQPGVSSPASAEKDGANNGTVLGQANDGVGTVPYPRVPPR